MESSVSMESLKRPDQDNLAESQVKRILGARRKRIEIRRLKLKAMMDSANVSLDGQLCGKSTVQEAGEEVLVSIKKLRVMPASKLQGGGTASSSLTVEIACERRHDCLPEMLSFGHPVDSTSSKPSWKENTSCPPHAIVSICGCRSEMEDAAIAAPNFVTLPVGPSSPISAAAPLHFFAVYDGHGGSQAALFCKEQLHKVLANAATGAACDHNLSGEPWQQALRQSFCQTDQEFGGGQCPRGAQCARKSPLESQPEVHPKCCPEPLVPGTVGTTAIVAVVGCSQITVANCGDSRAVLSRAGKAIPLSSDHKPSREDEMRRIEESGGRVIFWDGYRVLGVLAMSRAIGDRFLKPFIIPDPEIICTDRTDEDECLILASDGIWDVLSNELACEVARRCLNHQRNKNRSNGVESEAGSAGCSGDGVESGAARAAAMLTELAIARGSKDNISVVVIDLWMKRTL